jgi:hypothetical protein
MGVWCAVYAPDVQMKADRGVERSCTRRGTKKRGKGSSMRKTLKRAMARVARDLAVPLTRKLEKVERSRIRIDKLYERSLGFGFKQLSRVAETESLLKELQGRLEDPTRSRLAKMGLRAARDRTRSTLSTQRSRAIKTLSGVWGLPQDATVARINRVREPCFHAVPRMTLAALGLLSTEAAAAARAALVRAYGIHGPVLPAEVSCPCKRCRTSVLCDKGHGVAPGVRSCVRCDWVRPGCLGPSVGRTDGIGRRERKYLRNIGAPRRPT